MVSKSRSNWVQFGDRNMKFFHTSTLNRRSKNKILSLKGEDGHWLTYAEVVKQSVLAYFLQVYMAKSLAGDFITMCPKYQHPLSDHHISTLIHVSHDAEILTA